MPPVIMLRAALFVVLSASSFGAFAGGNMRSEGESDVSLGVSYDFGDRVFDKSGRIVTGRDCSTNPTFSFYGERGVSYYTTVFASSSVHNADCPDQAGPGMGNSEVGLRRRINVLADDWVWESGLILPTSKIGNKKKSDPEYLGWAFGLHWNPKGNPYDLSIDKDYLSAEWGFGLGLHGWFANLPTEASASVSFRKQLRLSDWLRDIPAIGVSAELSTARSIAQANNSNDLAVDRKDSFQIYSASFGLSYRVSRLESLRLTLQGDFAGKNRSDNSGITLSYGRTFPR